MKSPTRFSSIKILAAIVALCLLAVPKSTFAAPIYRGFQVGLDNMTPQLISELKNTWHVNVVRVQIGDDAHMDGTVGADYVALMDRRMAVLDTVLPSFQANGIKVVFALYSPPGGFASRDATAHYLMFVQPALQQQFYDMWSRIAARYGNNSAIYAFDLLNEPAFQQRFLAPGAADWNGMITPTIQAVRAFAPNKPIIVKSIYADPMALAKLPALNFPNLIYSYHAYPYLQFQESGISNPPFKIATPKAAVVEVKMMEMLTRFFFKQHQRYALRQISEFPSKLNIGETAASACAKNAGVFLKSVLSTLEKPTTIAVQTAFNKFSAKSLRTERSAVLHARKGSTRKLPTPTWRNFAKFAVPQSYTEHAFAESPVWDPRFVCSPTGALSQTTALTDRAVVLQSFFSRNH